MSEQDSDRTAGQPPYGSPQGQPPYGTPQGQPQYGQPQYGQPQYGAPQYGTGYEPSQAVLALVLGLVGVFVFQVVAPFAWVIANREITAIDAGRRNPNDRGMAVAGKVLGIIGTVLLVLFVLFVILAIAGLFAFSFSGGSTSVDVSGY